MLDTLNAAHQGVTGMWLLAMRSISADYFLHMGHTYGVIVERFSNWFHIWRCISLKEVLTDLCRGWGVPDALTSDDGPQFVARVIRDFCAQHVIHHRVTSVASRTLTIGLRSR